MQCTYCGAEMREDSVLCTACGRLTPEYERNYRRPDPTIGSSRRRRDDWDEIPRPSRAETGTARVQRNVAADDAPEQRSRKPRTLIALVLGIIAVLFAFAFVAGSFLPREITETYREAVEMEEEPSGSTARSDYEALVDAYFAAVEQNDEAAVRALYAAPLRSEDIEELDSWSFSYGDAIESYSVTDLVTYDDDELGFMSDYLEEPVEQYVDIKASVRFEADDFESHYDLDAVQIGDDWYLVFVW